LLHGGVEVDRMGRGATAGGEHNDGAKAEITAESLQRRGWVGAAAFVAPSLPAAAASTTGARSVAKNAVSPQPTETDRDTGPAEGTHLHTLDLLSPGDAVT